MQNTAKPLRTARHLKTLRLRLATQQQELAEATTAAMARCVRESLEDTERQLAEALG